MLSILYRGPLSSCNYACSYCPFAKHHENRAEHRADQKALERFISWVEEQTFPIAVFFTPWGEALIRERYRKAITRLSQMPQVQKVAVQTNLSCNLKWLEHTHKPKVALWCTFHPSEIERERFLQKCLELDSKNIRFSVGTVGIKENFAEIEALRAKLPQHIYLWVNALQSRPNYYSPEDLERLVAVDPLFMHNTRKYPSRGKSCRTGESVIAVDGDGTITRCHFIPTPIGNIYHPDFAEALKPRLCSRALCDCHIGYVHMDELGLYEVYGEGILERIPTQYSSSTKNSLALTS